MAKKHNPMGAHSSKEVDKPSSDWGNGMFANMPQEVKMKPWPHMGLANDESLDDTIVGIDSQRKDSHAKMQRHHSKSMY